MLNFGAITPHPPILVPGIGAPTDLTRIAATKQAMEKLAGVLQKKQPETIIVISPHAPLRPDSFGINVCEALAGDLCQFGSAFSSSFANHLSLTEKIAAKCKTKELPVFFFHSTLDHGALVPLFYLAPKAGTKLVHLAFSFLPQETHFAFGQALGEVLNECKEKTAIVASGDLSHRLSREAPAGYSPKGKIFDKELIGFLQTKNTQGILELDEDLVEEAGECGLKSIVILLGALTGKPWQFEQLGYEGPFGVGYLVANFKL